jgi:hypothetical protein
MSIFLLSLLACTPSSVSLDDGASVGEDADGDGIPDDQQQGDDEPEVHFASGGWSGDMGLYIPEWDWEVCEGEVELEVDDDGAFVGDSLCESESDWGTREYPVEFEGTINDDGDVEGVVVVEVSWGGGGDQSIEGELSGDAESDELVIDWISEMSFGGGNGGGGDAEVEGWADLER